MVRSPLVPGFDIPTGEVSQMFSASLSRVLALEKKNAVHEPLTQNPFVKHILTVDL